MSLRVIEPGLASRLVDGGRPGWRHFGVPTGGAADRAAWQRGNALLGNAADAVALEMALLGPTLEAVDDVGIAVSGAAFATAGRAFTLRAGERLNVGGARHGVRAYLCVVGGFDAAGEPLVRGDVLRCRPSRTRGRRDPSLVVSPCDQLRLLPGPQADWFDLAAFAGAAYRVQPASDRMGVRLAGPPLARPQRELVSEPVGVGTVQVTNDGQCIVLGRDGQTIGGYPRVAQVIAADWDALGQLRPGQAVRFAWVEESEAGRAIAERSAWLRREVVRRLGASEPEGCETVFDGHGNRIRSSFLLASAGRTG